MSTDTKAPSNSQELRVRLDIWLKVARIFKTRALANRACSSGRVRVNSLPARPHRLLSVEDQIEVKVSSDWTRVLVVRELRARPVKKAEAAALYEDIGPPRPQKTAFDRLMDRAPAVREKGRGRPTKRERRQVDQWRGRS